MQNHRAGATAYNATGANSNALRISQNEIDLDDIISDLHSDASSVQAHNPVQSNAQKRTMEQKKVTQQLMQRNATNKMKDVKSKIDTNLNVKG